MIRASVLGLIITSLLVLLSIVTLFFNEGSSKMLLKFALTIAVISILLHVEEIQYGFTLHGFLQKVKQATKDDKGKEEFVVRRVV